MRIEEERLVIDEPLRDDAIEEFMTVLSQDQIEKVVIEHDDIAASIVQAIWCSQKETDVKSDFLKPFFEHVVVGAHG